jgi:hypothetical protein
MKHLFSTAPDAKKRRRMEVTEVTGHGLCFTGRVQSVLSICTHLGLLIGRGGVSGHHAWHLHGASRHPDIGASSSWVSILGLQARKLSKVDFEPSWK